MNGVKRWKIVTEHENAVSDCATGARDFCKERVIELSCKGLMQIWNERHFFLESEILKP